MRKFGQISLSDIISLGFGGIFALATMYLTHIGNPFGFLTFLITIAAWITSFSSAMTIASLFAAGGFIELLVFDKSGLGALWLIISGIAFFLPHYLSN